MDDDREDRIRAKVEEVQGKIPASGDLISRLPPAFFELSDIDDIIHDLRHLPAIISRKKKYYNFNSDIEEFSIMSCDRYRLVRTLNEFYLNNLAQTKLFRIYFDRLREFAIVGSYYLLSGSERSKEKDLAEPVWSKLEVARTRGDTHKRIVFHPYVTEKKEITAEVANVSFLTVIKNIIETMTRFKCSFIEIWMNRSYSKRVRTLYSLRIRYYDPLDDDDISGLSNEVIHYLSPFIQTRSLFTIIGPVMVGPSSSHTAGAAKIGNIAREMLLSLIEQGKVKNIRSIGVRLVGSFLETGAGHSTPEAILGGLNGMAPDSPTLLEEGMKFMKAPGECSFDYREERITFSGFVTLDEGAEKRYSKEHNRNIAEILVETDTGDLCITGFSIGGGEIEIRYLNGQRLGHPIDGKSMVVLDRRSFPKVTEPFLGIKVKTTGGTEIRPGNKNEFQLDFNTFEEMLEIFGHGIGGTELLEGILKAEKSISGLTEEATVEKTRQIWEVMSESMNAGDEKGEAVIFNICGGDSGLLSKYISPGNIFGENLYTLALKYSLSVIEKNARHGLIVACPTAGSCGILPAVLRSWEVLSDGDGNEKKEKIIGALVTSGFLGMLFYDVVPTAGATYGCQAEIGVGAAMAASALTYLLDGNLEEIIHAFTLAIKNSMGLTCDPVSGLVEVPCIKRNGIFTSLAISSSLMALSGVRSVISPDEVILAVKEVGEKMSDDFKETARGGLAVTRDARKIEKMMEEYNLSRYG